MSTDQETPVVDQSTPATTDTPLTHESFAEQLRQQTIAIRFSRSAFWDRKKLTSEQTKRVADEFNAESRSVSGSKKLLDPNNAIYKAVKTILNEARAHWIFCTVPFPDKGVRLIRRDMLDEFDAYMRGLRLRLHEAAFELDEQYQTVMIPAAKDKLGELFNAADYPMSLSSSFAIFWEPVSVEPPDHLQRLHPRLYQQAQELAQARYTEAITNAEQEFAGELAKLMEHIVDRLTPGPEGTKAKVFRDSAVGNVNEFLARYRSLSIGSNVELDRLVERAQAAVAGIDAKTLRKDAVGRTSLAAKATEIREALDGLLIDQPERRISLDDDDSSAETGHAEPISDNESDTEPDRVVEASEISDEIAVGAD